MQAIPDIRSRVSAATRSLAGAAAGLTRFQTAVLVGLTSLLALGCLFAYVRSRPSAIKVLGKKETASPSSRSGTLTVHVAGAVNSPGLYKVPEGSRVADALSRAGGPAPDALLDSLNLAARIKDGEKVMVPHRSPSPSGANSGQGTNGAGESGSELVNINIAGIEELDRLPGIGPSLATRIIQYREKNGQFASIDELDDVPGIGPSKFESLKDLVTI